MHNYFLSHPELRPVGERYVVKSEAGEDVPFRRITLTDTPCALVAAKIPTSLFLI